MTELSKLKIEVAVWGKRNFPDAKPDHPLIGLAEECGELCHAHLKALQGIRGASAELLAAKKDAIGDMMIFLLHYCALNDLAVIGLSHTDDTLHPILNLVAAVGFLARVHEMEQIWPESRAKAEKQASALLVIDATWTYALSEAINFDSAVADTWAVVRQRDWQAKKVDGVNM